MGWKNWSYWLKLGLILGFLFGFLAFVNVFLVSDIEGPSSLIGDILENFDLLTFLMVLISVGPLLFLGIIDWDGNQPAWLESNFIFFSSIINFVFYFILGFIFGALIGWIYGKIRNR
ncbi:hypothetical protein KW805_03080 [Candidatus Pacearchaeota archaeon]|nr:hypothetical protein [Candidatus Pacearchaeota archaeon]